MRYASDNESYKISLNVGVDSVGTYVHNLCYIHIYTYITYIHSNSAVYSRQNLHVHAGVTFQWFPGVVLARFCSNQMAPPAFIIIGDKHLTEGTPSSAA